jgi:PAS domain S-box-containing protein
MDCKIIRPDGDCRHVHYRGTVTRDTEHYPVRMAGTIQDITEAKAVEQVLNDTLQRLHVATESGGIGIWDYFIPENRLVWDTRMLDLYGYTSDDFSAVYDAWASRLHPEDKARSEAALQAAVEGGRTFDTEFRLILPGGIVRHIKASAVVLRDTEGRAVRMVGVNYDISKTKQAEIAQRHLAAIVESSDDAIIGMDLAGDITSWNHGAQHIFGYTEEEMLGRAGTVLMLPAHTSEETKILAHLLHQGRIEHFETQHRCKDGHTIDVSVSISPIKDLADTVVGFAKVARDITERKTIELKLEQAARDLESRNQDLAAATTQALQATKAKSEFLTSMSHEIRTPMNTIVGMAELLHETPLAPDQRNYVDRFGRAATSLMELINAILDLSKIEAGHMELESIPFDLPDLVDSVVQLMATQATAKQLELLVYVHPDVPNDVVGDPTRLHQVLLNLTGNAIKFTDAGHVMIKVEPADDHVPLSALRFSVLDSGIGIPDSKLQIIFHSFTQADSTMTRKYGGTGLGLNISRRLVELMGGHIDVESTPGLGSTFSFVVQMTAAPPQRTGLARPDIDLRERRILVVDHNDTDLMIIREHLSRLGALLTEAVDGAAALTALEKAQRLGEPMHLAILDAHLPDMNGLELAKAIRNREDCATLPLVLTVSGPQKANTRQAQELRVASYLHKPVNNKRLLGSVAAALNQKPAVPGQHEPATQLNPSLLPALRILLVEDLEDNSDVIRLFLKDTSWHLELAVDGAMRRWEHEQNRPPTPILAFTANAFKEESDRCLAAGCTAHVTKPVKKKPLLDAIVHYASPSTKRGS